MLILGAGASAPYGYKLGKGLVERILGLTAPEGGQLWPILTGGYQVPLLREFRESLQRSRPASIDDYLATNSEFRELGRVCITAVFSVFGPRNETAADSTLDWMEYLWSRLHYDALTHEDFAGNQLKVITFNYDTSFERYFDEVLGFYYPDLRKGQLDVKQFRKTMIPTVHIHGSLGSSIEEVRGLADPLQLNRITWYKRAANDIRILTEGDHAVEYSHAHEWIGDADVIYFLGFGYHETNTKRLDLRGQITATAPKHPERIVKGTSLGLGESERLDVKGRLNLDTEMSLRSSGVLQAVNARAFLENHGLA